MARTTTVAEHLTAGGAVVSIRRHGLILHTYSAACSGCPNRLVNGPDEKGYPAWQFDGVVLWAEFHSAECDRRS